MWWSSSSSSFSGVIGGRLIRNELTSFHTSRIVTSRHVTSLPPSSLRSLSLAGRTDIIAIGGGVAPRHRSVRPAVRRVRLLLLLEVEVSAASWRHIVEEGLASPRAIDDGWHGDAGREARERIHPAFVGDNKQPGRCRLSFRFDRTCIICVTLL